MTVENEVSRAGPYTGNGVTTVFPFGFKIYDQTHLTVIRTALDGTETTLALTTDYFVSGVGDNAGQVTTNVAPASGIKITILLNVPFTQDIDLENQGAYYAEVVERGLDMAAQRDQQMAEELSRAVKVNASSPLDAEQLVAALFAAQAAATAAANAAAVAQAAAEAAAALAQAAENSLLVAKGDWVTATSYKPSDIVYVSATGSSYVCIVAHVSGTFATDLAALRWTLFARVGASGGGSGDMLKANNLSELANFATARGNLGLGALATKANILVSDINASALVVSVEGIAGNDNDTTVPTSAAVKDYVDDAVAAVGGISASDLADFAAGVIGQPRVALAAIEVLAAGTTIRSRNDAVDNNATTTFKSAYIFAFMQRGTVRVTCEHRRNTGGDSEARVTRTRNGTDTILQTWSTGSGTYQARSLDVDVLPGDVVVLSHRITTTSGGANSDLRNMRFQTNGENLWPGSRAQLENTF